MREAREAKKHKILMKKAELLYILVLFGCNNTNFNETGKPIKPFRLMTNRN